ncbi:MAG TPA: hypothetical protein VK154_07735 [Chitinophagales bacterium]|nr:hypothetical protein [Chitinophagales bacterium]
MKYIPSILTAAVLLSACNNKPQAVEATEAVNMDTTTVTTAVTNSIKCYAFTSKGLTVNMYIEQYGTEVTGRLTYDFAIKDDNEGLLKGRYYGDTLIADYAFKSEGTTSIRQVAFVKNGNQLTEGYGDVAEKEGKMMFKNRSSLSFTGTALNEVPCKE